MTRPVPSTRVSAPQRASATGNSRSTRTTDSRAGPVRTSGGVPAGGPGGLGSLDKAASAQATATSTALRGRYFPNPVAVYSDHFVFTTLDQDELEKHKRTPYVHPHTKQACRLFTLDNEVEYRPFAKDYGPLNLAYTVHGVCSIQDIIQDQPPNARPLCFYTMNSPETKANIALLASLYYMLVEGLDPAMAFMPIAKLEIMPFRDAGNGVFDHALSIQDCLYGIEKAHRYNLLGLDTFDIKEYVYYEQVVNGDLNILGPFIPFASPIEEAWIRAMQPRWQAIANAERTGEPLQPFRPLLKGRLAGNLAFRNVLNVFEKQDVGLVVRLNDELYDKRHFTAVGMEHAEMYFDDGTCPTDEIVREFIDRAIEQIERGKKVAVHCKAGLGRTGVLIGAYFIYKYGFSAQEVIAFMRIVRPGMVVGPQQQYMLANQMKWAQWAAKDELRRELGLLQASQTTTTTATNLATPPADNDLPLPPLPAKDYRATAAVAIYDIDMDHQDMHAYEYAHTHSHGQALDPASHHKHGDAVGQPRKTANASGKRYVEASSIPTPTAAAAHSISTNATHGSHTAHMAPAETRPSAHAGSTLTPSRMPSPSPTPERTLSAAAEREQKHEYKAKALSAAGNSNSSASQGASSTQSSMRGTKRGKSARNTPSARQAFAGASVGAGTGIPSPSSSAGTDARGQQHADPTTPRAALDLPAQLPYLERSPSLLSVTSENDRPRKKMHGTGAFGSPSPLSPSPLGGRESAGSNKGSITQNGTTTAVRGKLRKDQGPPVSGNYGTMGGSGIAPPRTSARDGMSAQSLTAAVSQVSASARTNQAPSRIPAPSVSAPATTRRHASPLRESTSQASSEDMHATPTAGAGAGSRIPRMGMTPGSPLFRALGGKGQEKEGKPRSKVQPTSTATAAHTAAGASGIPLPGSAAATAPSARRQGVMGALSSPRLGAMWSGLSRTQA